MHRVTRFACLSATILVAAACSKSEPPKDTAAAMTPAPAPAPAPAIALADVAGKWQVAATPVAGKDTSPTTFELTATPDTTGWSMTFTKSKLKVPVQVSVDGDSIRLTSGVFASQRRKGAKVQTDTRLHLKDGKLVGTTTAHYQNAGADSVAELRTEGSRAP